MARQGVSVEEIRAVDHDIATGVWPDSLVGKLRARSTRRTPLWPLPHRASAFSPPR